jgi:membrane protease YdiL (CAAX protease family)
MGSRLDLVVFLVVATAASIVWGRINRIGYSGFITSLVHFCMKYSKMQADLLRCYLVWSIYLLVGVVASVALLAAYQVNLLRFLALDPRYFTLVPLVFIAQNSLTGFMMSVVTVAKPATDVFAELTSITWVRYTLMMPSAARVISPLSTAICEEVFFRGTVFLILTQSFPQTGAYFAIFVCTALFVVQQVLQTDTLGQALIFVVGSTSISVVGCIATLYTGSFLPTLLCHAAYAGFYLQLGTALPASNPKSQRSKPRSAY